MKVFVLLVAIIYSNVLTDRDRVFNSNKSFSFIPAKEWKNDSEDSGLTFRQPLKNMFDHSALIQISEYPANGMNLEAVWDSYVLRDFPEAFENYRFIQSWNTQINGKKAKWVMFTNTFKGNKNIIKNLVYVFVENNKIYQILCVDTERDYESSEKEFRQMINTFKIYP